MKKAFLLTVLFTLLFVLAACGSSSASTNGSGSGGSSSTNSFRSGTGASTPLTPESKLALGTIKLEGTNQAIDPKMATSLLPLWQLLLQLKSSSSSAPQEVTAVVDQIHSTMTPIQIKTINSMTLSQADIFTAFQGQANGSGGSSGAGSGGFGGGGNRGGGGFVFAGGGPGGPGGGFGGGFRNGGTAGSTLTQTSSTLTEAQAAQARQNAVTSLLINQLIRLLETKLRS